MAGRQYKAGYAFERKVRDYLRRKGYFVIRAGGSKFPDLTAFRKKDVFFIECKVGGRLSAEEKEEARKLYDKTGIPLKVAYYERHPKDKRRTVVKFRMVT